MYLKCNKIVDLCKYVKNRILTKKMCCIKIRPTSKNVSDDDSDSDSDNYNEQFIRTEYILIDN